MFLSARRTNEGEVIVGILELGMVGEDLVHEERDRIVIIVAINRVAYES